MRGTLFLHMLIAGLQWIIPADAGNTSGADMQRLVTGDHPRGCGEHDQTHGGGPIYRGSSPRMRGTRSLSGGSKSSQRIIPADAGNTAPCPIPITVSQDHPRGCGEHSSPGSVGRRPWGSSPRMRGTPVTATVGHDENRIIPADAGNTRILSGSGARSGDHPRGCGEHIESLTAALCKPGSSPRMRGTPSPEAPRKPDSRIIPADAGNTRFQAL